MRFEPNMHTALWGTENWVCSAHHTSPSVIRSGAHAGKTLDQVYPDFPLLMKVIDAIYASAKTGAPVRVR